MPIRPINDRVLLKREASADKVGSLYIPDNAKEKSLWATVVAVGPGAVAENGRRIEPNVKAGDRVLIESKYAGNEVEIGGGKHLVVREHEITAVETD